MTHPKPISRAEAKALGLKRYFTGKPCSRGHVCERRVSSFGCHICHSENQKTYAAANPDAISATNKKHYYANHAEMIARAVRRAKTHPEAARANARQYYARHPEKYLAHARNRKARLRAADGSHTAGEIRALYHKQSGRCPNCRCSLARGYHADHIVPLIRGGSNWISNIQLLCPPCNTSKKAMDPIAWAQREGRLL